MALGSPQSRNGCSCVWACVCVGGGGRIHLLLALVICPIPVLFRCLWPPSIIYYLETVCSSYPLPVSLPVSPSAATIYLLGWRSFSRYSLVYQTLPCHIRLISSSLLTHPVPPCICYILLLCESYSLLLYHTGTYVHPCPPDYWHISFFRTSRSPTQNRSFSFSRSPLGRANTFSFQNLPSAPRISLECFSSFTLFLSANLSLSCIIHFASALYPPNSIDG